MNYILFLDTAPQVTYAIYQFLFLPGKYRRRCVSSQDVFRKESSTANVIVVFAFEPEFLRTVKDCITSLETASNVVLCCYAVDFAKVSAALPLRGLTILQFPFAMGELLAAVERLSRQRTQEKHSSFLD